MSYSKDRAWSDAYIPEIKRIVGPLLLEPAPIEKDVQQATDLIVLTARDMRIAARVRRPGYANRYPYEFTVRSQRDSGASTELEKMENGWGDWMFYGHGTELPAPTFARWHLIDLHAWRAHLIRNHDVIGIEKKSNGDGTHFVSFDLRTFPARPSIVVATSHPWQQQALCVS